MPIKLTVNGQSVEFESATDAAAILSAMSGSNVLKRRQAGRPVKKGRGERPIMNPNVRSLLQALKESFPDEMTTTDLARRLDKPAKSLPPFVTALGNWARKARLDPSAVMRRKSSVENGKPVSTYSITQEGIEVLQKELSRA